MSKSLRLASWAAVAAAFLTLPACSREGDASEEMAAEADAVARPESALALVLDPTVDELSTRSAGSAEAPGRDFIAALEAAAVTSLPDEFELGVVFVGGSRREPGYPEKRYLVDVDVTTTSGRAPLVRRIREIFSGEIVPAYATAWQARNPGELESCLAEAIYLAIRSRAFRGCGADSNICSVIVVSDLMEACADTTNFDREIDGEFLSEIANELQLPPDRAPDCVYVWHLDFARQALMQRNELQRAWQEFFGTLGIPDVEFERDPPLDLMKCN